MHMNVCLSRSLCLAILVLGNRVSAYTALPRWGQATAVINDALFVHGGKTDESNSYSYTSAPSNNDLLFLSLSAPFDLSSPPWQLVSSSTNPSTSQGPALAWHTLSAYNNTGILLFGGLPDPNSPTVLPGAADSAALLDVNNHLEPSWTIEPTSWAGEPIRRIHHSTSTTVNGLIYIIGGEKADGSNNALSDHYIFNINGPSFTQLPTTNGPPDIFGHTSIILSTGQLLVFGGYCPSQGNLVPFSTIWAIDTTQPTLTWTTLPVSTSALPTPRRAFAAVLLDGERILIHGGADATLQTTYVDGWILDSSQNPLVWTKVEALSQVGARRDHFAVRTGSQVIFGFGYGSNSAAPAGLQIYDTSGGSFITSFTPPPPPSTPTIQTLPGASNTIDSPSHSGGSSGHGSGSSIGAHSTSVNSPGTGENGGNTGQNNVEPKSGSKKAIALGTVFGVLGLIAGTVVIVYYARRRVRRRVGDARFKTLGDEADGGGDGGDSPHLEGAIPAAGAFTFAQQSSGGRKGGVSPGWNLGILNSLGLAGVVGAGARRNIARRDMLADEDTRDFGPWYEYERRMRDGSGGSSWSLRTIFGGMGIKSREPSVGGHLSALGGGSRTGSHWKEKSDPFSDGAVLMRNEEPRPGSAEGIGDVIRPSGRRQASYASIMSRRSYVDPFADPIQEQPREEYRHDLEDREGVEVVQDLLPSYPYPTQPAPPFRSIPPTSMGTHTPSPLAEQASQNTLAQSDPASSVSSHTNSNERAISPFNKSGLTSLTSLDPSRSPCPRTTSIIDANLPPTQPMRRSDSWWARFSRTSFLDRRTSDPSRRSRSGGMLDIRDPKPPPRLVAIEESMHSGSPDQDSPKSHYSNSPRQGLSLSRRGSEVYYDEAHRKSMSSLQTSRTADSEAIEKMAGMMDVVQVRSGSERTRESSDNSLSIDTHVGSADWGVDRIEVEDGELMTFTSPVEMTQAEASSWQLPPASSPAKRFSPVLAPPAVQTPSPASSAASLAKDGQKGPPRPLSGGAVASRVQAYERRMSLDREVPSPTNTRQWEERTRKKSHGTTVNYGLVPRPSLYVANPDHGAKPSGDS